MQPILFCIPPARERQQKRCNKFPRIIKKERMARLVDVQNTITLEHNLPLENQVVEVLVEGKSKKNPERWSGRTRTNKTR